MKISIPDFSLVVLIGPTGSGKSSFAHKHFLDTEIISSDTCRALVSDNEEDQGATSDAFDLLHHMAGLRLKRRKLTVVDATSVRPEDRQKLVALARKWHALPVALVLDINPRLCSERNEGRTNRNFGYQVPLNHSRTLRRSIRRLAKEGFRHTTVMRKPEEVDSLEITRERLWTDRRDDRGPFDIIGDVHGCFEELSELLTELGYELDPYQDGEELLSARHPEGRQAFFVGDITDRGPRNVDCLRLVMGMIAEGTARCVLGNHDHKLEKWLWGKKVKLNHGLELTVAELEESSAEFREGVVKFIGKLVSHQWLDHGRLVIAHAGLKEEMHGRGSGAVRSFAMFGETTGEIDEFGLPVRIEWARDYRGEAAVIYGHTPMHEVEWLNNTLCLDTGCVFGGKLTALRWPEKQTLSVAAKKTYADSIKPLDAKSGRSAQQDNDRLIYFDDFIGKQRIITSFGNTVIIPEENSLAALEVLSRFAVDPRWLIYLPPTMAPCATALQGPCLEHPDQALDYFVKNGVSSIIAEEKHMGSRALLVICKSAEAAAKRFGVEDGKAGVIYTRTGRSFFKDDTLEAAVVDRIAKAVEKVGLWSELESDWLLLDAELMPWSAKAQELLVKQYGPTVSAAQASADALLTALEKAGAIEGLEEMKTQAFDRAKSARKMGETIDGYCWEANSIGDYRIAPFHLLAAEGRVFVDKGHRWHMERLSKLCAHDPILQVTEWRELDPAKEVDRQALIDWWFNHTAKGGEGMVLKPSEFLAKGERGFLQPALKVRGQEYLRIIYGPAYDEPGNIERLRKRGLKRKYSLAMREFSLGIEGLQRFVDGRPLRSFHECVLGVLALESEPVDPRL